MAVKFTKQEKRLETLCVETWQLLTNTERENYFFDCGTIDFVENIANLIYFDIESLAPEKLDIILDKHDTLYDED